MLVENLTQAEKEQIYTMAENMTGNCQSGSYRKDVIISNVLRRIQIKKAESLQAYLQVAISNDQEFGQLMSAMTIHTTEWFRELPHFKKFDTYIHELSKTKKRIKMLCAACSTGEEVYSFSFLLETFKASMPSFDYEMQAFDIDPVSVEVAKKGLYSLKNLPKIDTKYQQLVTKQEIDESFVIAQKIRDKCRFSVENLMKLVKLSPQLDVIVCRNVLIYFTSENVKEILEKLLSRLNVGGILLIGHSDSLDAKLFNLKSLGNSIFEKL